MNNSLAALTRWSVLGYIQHQCVTKEELYKMQISGIAAFSPLLMQVCKLQPYPNVACLTILGGGSIPHRKCKFWYIPQATALAGEGRVLTLKQPPGLENRLGFAQTRHLTIFCRNGLLLTLQLNV